MGAGLDEWTAVCTSGISVATMDHMFLRAAAFNQDLSAWCVRQFSEELESFSLLAEAWTEPQPVWGTCPSP